MRPHQVELVQTAARHGATNLRVFGSVARGEDDADSDVDLLVDLGPDTGLLRRGRLERDFEALLGVSVDVVPADDLKPGVAADALGQAVP